MNGANARLARTLRPHGLSDEEILEKLLVLDRQTAIGGKGG